MKHLLIIFSLIFNNLLLASEFKYHTVYYCGPEKLGILDWYMVLGKKRYDYFFINFSDNEKFVILHRDIQYTNFRDTKINTLYNQQGGTFYATMKEIEGVLVFKLLDREDTGYVKTLNVDLESMTYISRVSDGETKYKAVTGICELHDKK